MIQSYDLSQVNELDYSETMCYHQPCDLTQSNYYRVHIHAKRP